MKQIGFIGVGIMGRPMVRNLMKNGYDVHIFARNRAKVEDVISEGAVFHDTIAECVNGRDAVITIVGYPQDVEEVYFAKGNILDSAEPGTYLIDMTTTTPSLEEKIAACAAERDLPFLDAPVTGGEAGAKAGTLSILVGGKEECFESCREIFMAMGKTISYYGPSGCGQHAKLANQILQASILSGVCESMAYAQKKGIDLNRFLTSTRAGSSQNSIMDRYGERIIAGDMNPGFFIDLLIKDMQLGYDSAAESELELPNLKLTLDHYRQLSKQGLGKKGMQALIKYYLRDIEED